MESRLREEARALVGMVINAYRLPNPVDNLGRILDSARDIRVCYARGEGGFYLDEVKLVLNDGRLREEIIVRENEIVGKICKDGMCVEEVERTREANEVLDYLEEIIAHRVW